MGGRGVAEQLHQPRPRVRARAGVRDRVCGGVSVGEGGRGGVVEAMGVVWILEIGATVEGRGGRRVGVGPCERWPGSGARRARE